MLRIRIKNNIKKKKKKRIWRKTKNVNVGKWVSLLSSLPNTRTVKSSQRAEMSVKYSTRSSTASRGSTLCTRQTRGCVSAPNVGKYYVEAAV